MKPSMDGFRTVVLLVDGCYWMGWISERISRCGRTGNKLVLKIFFWTYIFFGTVHFVQCALNLARCLRKVGGLDQMVFTSISAARGTSGLNIGKQKTLSRLSIKAVCQAAHRPATNTFIWARAERNLGRIKVLIEFYTCLLPSHLTLSIPLFWLLWHGKYLFHQLFNVPWIFKGSCRSF